MKWETLETPKSSRIVRISYMEIKPLMGKLQVIFRGKKNRPNLTYEYNNVPRQVWVQLYYAESKGQAFDSLVKNIYTFKKL